MLPQKTEGIGEYYQAIKKRLEKNKPLTDTSSFIDGKMGGWTMYNGAGGSGKLLRVYDKGAKENGRPGLWIRFELQVGRDYATNARKEWQADGNPTAYAFNSVRSYCAKNDIYFPDIESSDKRLIIASKVKFEAGEKERALVYMRNNVAPFIKRFRGLYDDDTTLLELGLLHLKG